VKDIGALIDWVQIQPNFDKERVGVYGRSYGGYMVLASMIDYGEKYILPFFPLPPSPPPFFFLSCVKDTGAPIYWYKFNPILIRKGWEYTGGYVVPN
jgi:dienelactone hydrolase